MQRWVTTLVGLAVVVLAIALVAHGFQPPRAIGHDPNPHASAADGGADDGGGTMAALGAPPATAPVEDAGPLLLSDLVAAEAERRIDGGVGTVLPDGAPVPPLPLNVPRHVRFGVVLVSYSGAQPSAGGGHPTTRSRADAKVLAAKLLATAQQDFHAAVQQGDAGSSDDVGQVRLGVIEPAPEYVLFTSPVDAVAGPVDTPRGYWIVKRLE
ncbi:MAG TPA: hypothetical protein VH044_02525 [Polyangiaceae bacterium]|jgi:hypothetical protein|nr:hypothetical protein [Polyangiaceae bacterium]